MKKSELTKLIKEIIVKENREKTLGKQFEPNYTKEALMQIMKYKESLSRDSAINKNDKKIFKDMLQVIENTLKGKIS